MTNYKEWPDEPIDLLVGGTPCQSFSVAGLRKGLADPRGNLMLTFLAVAKKYNPQWIVWENVPGVLSSNKGRDFGTFLSALGECGYGFAYRVLDAQYFGLAQRRKRVFVVGYLGDWRRAAAVLFERESMSGDPAPSREAKQKVAGTIAASSFTGGPSGKPEGAAVNHFVPTWPAKVASTLNAAFAEKQGLEDQHINGGAPLFVPAVTYALPGNWIGRKPENGGNQVEPFVELSPCQTATDVHAVVASRMRGFGDYIQDETARTIKARDVEEGVLQPVAFSSNMSVPDCQTDGSTPTVKVGGHGGGNPPAVAFQQNTRDEVRYINGNGQIAGALSANSGMKQTNYLQSDLQVRRLTPTECERLQGFPDNYTQIPYRNKPADKCPDGHRYKAMGNSMAVPVMRWIGERIQMVEEIK